VSLLSCLHTECARPSSVQASFGFNFGALGARPAKQASLPPQLSSRRTPVRTTPRATNGSTKRNRSASVQRSSNSKRGNTPKNQAVTPQLGKRKRGSTQAEPSEDDGEEDELSPDREELVRSIEKSRRVVGTVSPIREEVDEAADELSVLEEGISTVRKATMHASGITNGTPVSVLAQKRVSSGNVPTRTPITDRISSVGVTSRQSIPRRSKSTELGPVTPGMPSTKLLRPSSAPRSGGQFDSPTAAQADDESEDELSPPQVNGATPRIVSTEQQLQHNSQEEDRMEIDELSSPIQPTPVQETLDVQTIEKAMTQGAGQPKKQIVVQEPAKRGRPRRIVSNEDDEALSVSAATKPAKRGRPAKSAELKATATPAARKQSGRNPVADSNVEEDEQIDELSPDKERTTESSRRPAKRSKDIIPISDGEESEEYEEPDPDEQPVPTPRPAAKRISPKQTQHIKLSSENPPRKRHRFLGPKHAISVMRIKGSTVRGITVADTTRTILEETIDHRLTRMAGKMQTTQDSAARKELRGEINMSLSFKESLNEKLLDLQDANDVLSTNFKKMKLFKRDNAELRRDILTLQNNRQEIALEHDDVQAEYDAEKAKVDAKSKLSEDIYSIEAAIQNGRKKARKEHREDEGPEIPLSMLLGMVGGDVGSSGGGLLKTVKIFNSALESAAGWLEGRA
jgi:hypothetical protein